MKIVIEIDEDAYKEIKKIVADGNEMCFMQKLIANGTPLPKGHGSLIDADELFDKIQFADFSSSNDVNTALFCIGNAPTIIEADKEEE